MSGNRPRNYIPLVYCVEGSTIKLQKMTGENDNLDPGHPVNNTQSQFGVVGADLGTPVEVSDRIYFLFGDTNLSSDRKIGNNFPSGHFFNDDSIGWTNSPDPEHKMSLEFVNTIDSNGKKTYVSPVIYNNGVPLPSPPSSLQVPTGGFSANNKLYAIYTVKNNDIEELFKGTFDFNSAFLALKKDGINLAPVKEADDNWNATGNDFWIANWEIMWKSFLVSTDGIDPEHSVVNNNIKFNCVYPLSNIYNRIENSDSTILRKARIYSDYRSRTIDSSRIYLVLDLDRFSDFNNLGKFIHVSAKVVNNSTIPDLPDSSGQGLLLWGIGLFRRSNPFLAYIPLAGLEHKENISYYAGRQAGTKVPVWSESEQDATPLFDHPVIGEFDVTWNKYLKVWVMLYNNDIDAPFLNKPATFIQFRVAINPWGPWSEAGTLFDPATDDQACNVVYYQWKQSCDGRAGADDFPNANENGNPYAPFVMSRYTRKKDKLSTMIYYIMSTWRPYNTAIMKSELKKSRSAVLITYRGNPALIQSTFGNRGNFEVISCFRATNPTDAREPLAFSGRGLVHFFRNNDYFKLPWSNFTPVTTFPPAVYSFDSKFTSFENLTFIQSNFGSDHLDKPANFEVIGRIDDKLKHIWRESKYPFYWRKNDVFLKIDNSYDLAGVTGNPSLIQSTFGERRMNFELAVPLIGGGIYHLFKSNDGNDPGVNPWWIGNNRIPIDQARKYQAVSLIQSNYNRPIYAGNLELVARAKDKLRYFWMDSSTNPTQWHGPLIMKSNGVEITGVTGIPSLIQSTFGQKGNFDIVVPLRRGGIMHYFHDNDSTNPDWQVGNNGIPIDSTTKYEAVSLIQATPTNNLNTLGQLEVVALSTDGLLFHFSTDSETDKWSGPKDFASF